MYKVVQVLLILYYYRYHVIVNIILLCTNDTSKRHHIRCSAVCVPVIVKRLADRGERMVVS